MYRTLPFVFFLTSCLSLLNFATSDAADKPNFIIINIDDLGYQDIEPFGSKVNRTPHLNQMAKEGRKLTSFYAAPVCSPSRASLMTGCYPKRVLPIPHVLFPGNDVGLSPDEITIAELLKDQGYATGIVGKWHLGDQPEFLPTNQGFDYYFGLPYSNDMGPGSDGVKSNFGVALPKPRKNEQPPLPLLRNNTVIKRVMPNDQINIVESYTQEAVNFIWNHRDEPFFLYLPHTAVHFPLYPGDNFRGKSKHGLFGDWVEELDWSVGQVLQTLRELNLDEKTLVIFTSDNGGQNRHGAINLPLRGGKGSTLEGGIRVPTIAWWPKQIPAATEHAGITGMMDLMPTLVKLAGGEVPSDRKIDGADISELLTSETETKSPHDTFYYFRGLNLQAVRHQDWKLHIPKGDLYNLKTDIGESNDVAKEHPEVVKQLKELVATMDQDLGIKEVGKGVRKLGKVNNAQPLIAQDGTIRKGFKPAKVFAGTGLMIGELTATSALAQVRLSSTDQLVKKDLPGIAGVVRFSLFLENGHPKKENHKSKAIEEQEVKAIAEHDFIARAAFTKLSPGTKYTVHTSLGETKENLSPGPSAIFETLPGKEKSDAVKFVVVTGMNYGKFHGDDRIDRKQHLIENNTELPEPYNKPDKHLGYPALDTIRRLQPNFFVGTGDNVYYDTPDKYRAKSATEMRQKWHEQFVQPRYKEMFAAVPTYWMIDDHDYRIDDGDNSGDYDPTPEAGREMMLEQLPVAPMNDKDAKTYRTHRVNKDLQIWFPENRMYRSHNATKDGPEKTIWGAEQKAWLKKTLKESDAKFKLLISPTPMIGPDDLRKFDNHTNIDGFRHERDEFFAWLKETGIDKQNFYLVCGDRHWQYQSVHPTGMEEFSSGALVDANSRLGRLPGDPKSTDPKGLIKQPYTQKEPSGGFLMIEVKPQGESSTLTFTFHDEKGKLLYKEIKK